MVFDVYRLIRHTARMFLSTAGHLFLLWWIRFVVMYRRRRRSLIAICLLEHLGDIVACEPIARTLRAQHPDAYILWFIKPQYRELIDHNPDIDASVAVHCLTEKKYLAMYGFLDRIVDLHFPERFCSLCPEQLAKQYRRASSSEIGLANFYSYGNILQSFSRYAGINVEDRTPCLYIPDRVVRSIDAIHLPGTFIVVHCFSNTGEKDWMKDKWAELFRRINKELQISIVEIGMELSISFDTSAITMDLRGRLSILESAEVIRRALMFVGIDSGPAHLANAVGTPGVVLMGPLLGFQEYTPFPGGYGDGTSAYLVRNAISVSQISIDEVMEAVKKMNVISAVFQKSILSTTGEEKR